MAYRFQDDTEENVNVAHNKASLAIRFMIEDIHRISTPVTPMKTGQLRADINKEVRGTHGKISWGKHYAWYQERGYTSGPVRKYTTAGTGKRFAYNSVMRVANNSDTYFRRVGLL